MRIYVLFLTFLLAGVESVLAQINAGDDVTICNIQTVDLSADYTPNSVGTNDYTLENIPINMDPQGTGTSIGNLTDDSFSGIIDIGFDFCFYSNVYNQLLISTNNYVTFDLTESNGYSPGIHTKFQAHSLLAMLSMLLWVHGWILTLTTEEVCITMSMVLHPSDAL